MKSSTPRPKASRSSPRGKGKLERYSPVVVAGAKGHCYVGVVRFKEGAKLNEFVQFVFESAGNQTYGGPGIHDSRTGGVFTECPQKSGPLKLTALDGPSASNSIGAGGYDVVIYERKQSAKEAAADKKAYDAAVADDEAGARRHCVSCREGYEDCLDRGEGRRSCKDKLRLCIGGTTCR